MARMNARKGDGSPMDSYTLEIDCREPVLVNPDKPQHGYHYIPAGLEYEEWLGESLAGVLNYVHIFHHSFNEHIVDRIMSLSPSGDWVTVYPERKNR